MLNVARRDGTYVVTQTVPGSRKYPEGIRTEFFSAPDWHFVWLTFCDGRVTVLRLQEINGNEKTGNYSFVDFSIPVTLEYIPDPRK